MEEIGRLMGRRLDLTGEVRWDSHIFLIYTHAPSDLTWNNAKELEIKILYYLEYFMAHGSRIVTVSAEAATYRVAPVFRPRSTQSFFFSARVSKSHNFWQASSWVIIRSNFSQVLFLSVENVRKRWHMTTNNRVIFSYERECICH